ncbi:hypothetical protein EYF80_026393 [Liparis tanakae]|uniref:Uncharacterized protein n=1 Tax=Liparis tanakae TaxID=230148 RepID=A0A4Z2HCL7_9TELE|nr:hypothetical protein EYF80_026393 [Liparis tanakae]
MCWAKTTCDQVSVCWCSYCAFREELWMKGFHYFKDIERDRASAEGQGSRLQRSIHLNLRLQLTPYKEVECSTMVHRGEGGDAAALTFTAIQELFVVTGLETNTGPKGQRSGLNFIHCGGPSVGKDKQRKQPSEAGRRHFNCAASPQSPNLPLISPRHRRCLKAVSGLLLIDVSACFMSPRDMTALTQC